MVLKEVNGIGNITRAIQTRVLLTVQATATNVYGVDRNGELEHKMILIQQIRHRRCVTTWHEYKMKK